MYRYTVNISFVRTCFNNVPNIVERIKTLKEAQSYQSIIDDTVKKACIIDNVTGAVVKWLKQ